MIQWDAHGPSVQWRTVDFGPWSEPSCRVPRSGGGRSGGARRSEEPRTARRAGENSSQSRSGRQLATRRVFRRPEPGGWRTGEPRTATSARRGDPAGGPRAGEEIRPAARHSPGSAFLELEEEDRVTEGRGRWRYGASEVGGSESDCRRSRGRRQRGKMERCWRAAVEPGEDFGALRTELPSLPRTREREIGIWEKVELIKKKAPAAEN